MVQQAIEEGIGLCLISEPPKARDNTCRISSLDGRAAILWWPEELKHGLQCTLVEKGCSYVAVAVDDICLISTYISPNSTRREYTEVLDDLGEVVRARGASRTIIGGDFNARARTWDPFGVNSRGQLVEELDIRLINEGEEPTLVNPRGASVVDLTWATLDVLRRITGWAVSDRESLSDHKSEHISYQIRTTKGRPTASTRATKEMHQPRWNFNKLDAEKFCLSLEWNREDCPTGEEPAEYQAEWIGRRVKDACDIAAPRSGSNKPKRQTYWWSEALSELRNTCNSKRRSLTRFNRRLRHNMDRMIRPTHQGRQQQKQPQSRGSPTSQQEHEMLEKE